MSEYIYSIILVVIIIVVVLISTKKKKQETWKGTLEKKKENYADEDSTQTYSLIFKTEDGKKKRVNVTSRDIFESWSVGDKAEKKQGEYYPMKVQ